MKSDVVKSRRRPDMRKSFVKWFSMFKYFTKNTAGRANIWQRKKR